MTKDDLFRESYAKLQNGVAKAKLDNPILAKFPGFLPKEYRPLIEEMFAAAYEAGKRAGYDEELKARGYKGLEEEGND